jgi:hypothetical protein
MVEKYGRLNLIKEPCNIFWSSGMETIIYRKALGMVIFTHVISIYLLDIIFVHVGRKQVSQQALKTPGRGLKWPTAILSVIFG